MPKFLRANLILLGVAVCVGTSPRAKADPIDLGSASGFAVLAGAGISITGAVDSSSITGDIGTFPTTTITGLGSLVLNGTNQGGGAITQSAQASLARAYSAAVGLTPTTTYGAIVDLGGLTLAPGVYNDPSAIAVTGILTLNGQGNSNAVWVFQAGSTLTTATGSQILLENGAQAANVFWQVGSSATLLGGSSEFEGTVLANASISLGTAMTVQGALFAESGAVTLNSDSIMTPVPEPAETPVLVAACVALLMGVREIRRRRCCQGRLNSPA
jgi:hypothetical protein